MLLQGGYITFHKQLRVIKFVKDKLNNKFQLIPQYGFM